MAIIQTYGLSKRYGGTVAVDDVSFHLRSGKVTALLGPNGAGKSTTLRLMLDLERGDGETLFDGRCQHPRTRGGDRSFLRLRAPDAQRIRSDAPWQGWGDA